MIMTAIFGGEAVKDIILKAYGAVIGTLFRLAISVIFRPVVRDAENIGEGAVIFASNHTTLADGPVIVAAMWRRRRPAVFITDRWYRKRMLTPMFDFARCIPTDTEGKSTLWLRRGLSSLGEGKRALLIFPEGHTNQKDDVREFHGGAFLLAARSGAEVVPVYHTRPKAFRRTEIIIGEPMRLSPDKRKSTAAEKDFSERLRQAVAELGEGIR